MPVQFAISTLTSTPPPPPPSQPTLPTIQSVDGCAVEFNALDKTLGLVRFRGLLARTAGVQKQPDSAHTEEKANKPWRVHVYTAKGDTTGSDTHCQCLPLAGATLPNSGQPPPFAFCGRERGGGCEGWNSSCDAIATLLPLPAAAAAAASLAAAAAASLAAAAAAASLAAAAAACCCCSCCRWC